MFVCCNQVQERSQWLCAGFCCVLYTEQRRQLHEQLLDKQQQHRAPFVSKPTLCLAHHRVEPAEFRAADGCELGLFLLNDARWLCWTLNGEMMDTFDIGHYMLPVRDRPMFVSVMAMGGHQQNRWEIGAMDLMSF
eukprot:COSAG05_NODE_2919_length_2511_cov_1.360282_4_plen_135_part_00